MSSKLKTTLAFTKNLLTTGAFTETSKNVEKEITKFISVESSKLVVEFGMGHGNLTNEILKKMPLDSKLLAFEINKDFCTHVGERIKDTRLQIINDSAVNFKKYMNNQPVNNFISSIPFSFLSKEDTSSILNESYQTLTNNSYFSQVLYTKFNFKKFQKIFDENEIINLGGFPIEYIYHCRKKNENVQ